MHIFGFVQIISIISLFQSVVSGSAVDLGEGSGVCGGVGSGVSRCHCRYGVLLAASHFHFVLLN